MAHSSQNLQPKSYRAFFKQIFGPKKHFLTKNFQTIFRPLCKYNQKQKKDSYFTYLFTVKIKKAVSYTSAFSNLFLCFTSDFSYFAKTDVRQLVDMVDILLLREDEITGAKSNNFFKQIKKCCSQKPRGYYEQTKQFRISFYVILPQVILQNLYGITSTQDRLYYRSYISS